MLHENSKNHLKIPGNSKILFSVLLKNVLMLWESPSIFASLNLAQQDSHQSQLFSPERLWCRPLIQLSILGLISCRPAWVKGHDSDGLNFYITRASAQIRTIFLTSLKTLSLSHNHRLSLSHCYNTPFRPSVSEWCPQHGCPVFCCLLACVGD